ncbi:GTPase IMAP family member 7-like, partial [Clupea harengus]|uniref:GTPase IMAP family member 7-like n=1 Tax=Clupea harengus TaxID=7950 RepID=A0A8M1KBS7_CLUHA
EEKNKEMEKTKQQLEEKIKEMEKTKQQLEDKNKEMEKTKQQLEEKTKQQLEDKNKEMEKTKQQLEEKTKQQLIQILLMSGEETVWRETQHSESREGEVAGRRVTVVETPDWFCSGLSEKGLRQDVGRCVRLSAPGPHAFLLVIPVEPSEGVERKMLEKMEDMFGEGCWGHTLILFTHAEGMRERSVEELLQTGSQELQQLVEKCGNRCHLVNVKDMPDDTKITQLLEKIEEMVSGNRERFYSSETYQEAEKQLREIERIIQKEREVEERKLREERERREELDKNVQESLKMMEGEIQQHEGEIRTLNERTTELERKMKEERDEEK